MDEFDLEVLLSIFREFGDPEQAATMRGAQQRTVGRAMGNLDFEQILAQDPATLRKLFGQFNSSQLDSVLDRNIGGIERALADIDAGGMGVMEEMFALAEEQKALEMIKSLFDRDAPGTDFYTNPQAIPESAPREPTFRESGSMARRTPEYTPPSAESRQAGVYRSVSAPESPDRFAYRDPHNQLNQPNVHRAAGKKSIGRGLARSLPVLGAFFSALELMNNPNLRGVGNVADPLGGITIDAFLESMRKDRDREPRQSPTGA